MAITLGILVPLSHSRQIVMSMYTVQNGSLKMTAQIDSVDAAGRANLKGHLELFLNNQWTAGDTGKTMSQPGWTFHFRVNGWDDARDVTYRVRFDTGSWQGVVRKDPKTQNIITVGTISCISPNAGDGGTLPVSDIINNIRTQGVDLLVFNGDQVYNHTAHTANWRQFAYKFADLAKDIPSVFQTDDHDVGTPNLWGSGGKLSTLADGTDGGYYRTVSYVNMVNRVQTWHLPDPYDPTPILRGITVYYTALTWGEISFAVLEDRKWKSGPREILTAMPGPRWDHVTNTAFDVNLLDDPRGVFLGDRQHAFLRDWATNWRGAQMKCVLTQSPYGGLANAHGSQTNILIADLDANGWPQSQRNRALADIRRGFAFTIAGDQHLTTVAQMGVDDWRDAGWVFTAPAVSNLYQRWWIPPTPGLNRLPTQGPEYGDHFDGFRNRITMHAFGNPGVVPGTPAVFYDRSAGYGIVRFDKSVRTIGIEAWPREVDVTQSGARPYPGYPITVTQEGQYGKNAVQYLPTVNVTGMTNPMIQVIDPAAGTDSIVYTLRINGTSYRPKVFRSGTYTIRVCELGTANEQIRTGVQSIPASGTGSINIPCSPVAIPQGDQERVRIKDILAEWDPHSGSIVIYNPATTPLKADVLDSKGLIVHSRNFEGQGKYLVSLPHLFSGVYHVRVKSGDKVHSFKITTRR